ncbi:unnamed protein product [Rotaria magnacalcarata]|uniref:Uncharacterized protein n=3 Tax=Rotaria magnacalcarata TaxID=392030 RepID=A0A819E6A2_9BILA|nr:unnamed protein product [Rotaria magnacalcarata]CAF3845310.1 unnamed protein product [Rotaria magnacalcarata]CAF5202039.1 unnamed protein product [Rotaria magnacalcarata]
MERSPKFIPIFLSTVLIIGTIMIYQSFQFINPMSGVSNNRVRVEFFVMSKCPDAMKCETLFLPSLLKLSSIVNFTLSFIAGETKLNEFSCMHGTDECLGNKQQLCIQDMYSQAIFIKYLQCQSKHIMTIPNNGEQCAKTTSENIIRWPDVQSCVNSNRANQLFHKSLERTRSVSVRKSCTIYLNEQFWCMHDGFWSSCSEGRDEMSFIRAICSRYNGKNKPIECANFI